MINIKLRNKCIVSTTANLFFAAKHLNEAEIGKELGNSPCLEVFISEDGKALDYRIFLYQIMSHPFNVKVTSATDLDRIEGVYHQRAFMPQSDEIIDVKNKFILDMSMLLKIEMHGYETFEIKLEKIINK